MKTFKMLGIFILSLNTSLVFAQKGEGYGMGNGGDAVVCYTDATRSTITSVQMFDYWEQEQVVKYGKVDLGAPNLSVQEKIQIAVDRINKFDPELAEKIKFQALNLANNIQSYLVTSYQLPEIDDMTPQVLPKQPNCFIEQYGVQYKDVVTGQRRFYIADKFYNFSSTSNDDKAGLLLHEAIYRYAILQKPSLDNSDGVRYFNYIVGSSKLGSMSLDDLNDYVSYLSNAKINKANCHYNFGYYHINDYYPVLTNIPSDRAVGKSCYNQVIIIDNNISVEVKAGTFGTITKFWYGFNYKDNSAGGISVILKSGNYIGKYYTTKILKNIYEADRPYVVELGDQSKINSLHNEFFMEGPLGQKYFCDKNIILDAKTLDLVSCDIMQPFFFNGENYIFGKMKKIALNTWSIENLSNSSFNLLGSKYTTRITPKLESFDQQHSDYTICSREILVDNYLNLIESCIDNKVNAIISGSNTLLSTYISVTSNGAQFVLNSRFSDELIINPKVQNLRVLLSTDTIRYKFCRSGSEYSQYNKRKVEYITGSGESFYDLSTNKIVFKSDEDVELIESLICKGDSLTTTNY